MDEYRDELKQIENRLYEICKEVYGSVLDAEKLGYIWCDLYDYVGTI